MCCMRCVCLSYVKTLGASVSFLYLFELTGMLLSATDITVLLLVVNFSPRITDVVIVYFLIVMVRLIFVWLCIGSLRLLA